MKFGDAFFVRSRFGGTKYLKLFHKNMNLENNESGVRGAYGPEDYIELPLDTQGIFLEYVTEESPAIVTEWWDDECCASTPDLRHVSDR